MTFFKRVFLLSCLAGVFAGVFFSPSDAHARRGVMVFNTGDDIFEIGPLPEPFDKAPEHMGWKAGHMCKIAGVFWVYFHWWDCKVVAFQNDTYDDSPEIVSAINAKYPDAKPNPGFWKGQMRFVLGGLLVLAVIIGLLRRKR